MGKLIKKSDEEKLEFVDCYIEETDEYFFERSPKYFDPIFDYLSTGQLHIPPDVCLKKYMDELKYWKILESQIDECCTPFKEQNDSAKDGIVQEEDLFEGLKFGELMT